MRLAVGACVGWRGIEAVAVSRGRIVRRVERAWEEDRVATIAGVLREVAGPGRLTRPRVYACVGASACDVKVLHRLLPPEDVNADALVGANLEAFFVRPSAPTIPLPVSRDADGCLVAGWIEAQIVMDLLAATESAGQRLASVTPAATVARAVRQSGGALIPDGPLQFAVDPTAEPDLRIRRLQSEPIDEASEEGADDRLDIALWAVRAAGGTECTLRPGDHRRASRRVHLATGLATASALAILAFPLLSALHSRSGIERRLGELTELRTQVAEIERPLGRAVESLEIAAAFERRPSMLGILESVTDLLPDEAALMTFDFENDVVTLQVAAPSVPRVVERLGTSERFAEIELASAITPVPVGHATREQAVVKLRLARP